MVTIIQAISDTLILKKIGAGFFSHRIMLCVDSNQRNFIVRGESAGIVDIHNSTSRKNISETIRKQSYSHLFPVQQVPADCVSPMHGTPNSAVRKILKEQMIYSMIIYKAVRIIHPACFWREMNLRPVRLIVSFLSLHGRKTGKNDNHADHSPGHGIGFAYQDRLF